MLLGESHNGVSSYRKELIRVRGIGGADPEVLRHYFTDTVYPELPYSITVYIIVARARASRRSASFCVVGAQGLARLPCYLTRLSESIVSIGYCQVRRDGDTSMTENDESRPRHR